MSSYTQSIFIYGQFPCLLECYVKQNDSNICVNGLRHWTQEMVNRDNQVFNILYVYMSVNITNIAKKGGGLFIFF